MRGRARSGGIGSERGAVGRGAAASEAKGVRSGAERRRREQKGRGRLPGRRDFCLLF